MRTFVEAGSLIGGVLSNHHVACGLSMMDITLHKCLALLVVHVAAYLARNERVHTWECLHGGLVTELEGGIVAVSSWRSILVDVGVGLPWHTTDTYERLASTANSFHLHFDVILLVLSSIIDLIGHIMEPVLKSHPRLVLCILARIACSQLVYRHWI